jgi:hypothetical protein
MSFLSENEVVFCSIQYIKRSFAAVFSDKFYQICIFITEIPHCGADETKHL